MWDDLTLKDKLSFYKKIKQQVPVRYYELRDIYDKIPAYEDGFSTDYKQDAKNRKPPIEAFEQSQKEFESLHARQDSLRREVEKKKNDPNYKPFANSNTNYAGTTDDKLQREIDLVMNGMTSFINEDVLKKSIKDAQQAQYEQNVENFEPTKMQINALVDFGIPMLLGGGALIARNYGKNTIANTLQVTGGLLDTYQLQQGVENNDTQEIVKNAVPLGLTGLSLLPTTYGKYAPLVNNLKDIGYNGGMIWDLFGNSMYDAFQLNSQLQK